MNLKPSRYYGDMSPRTMHEAFGPYSRPLSVEQSRRRVRLRFVLAFIVALVLRVVLA